MISPIRTILRAFAHAADNATRRACYVAGASLLAWAARVPARRETETRAPSVCRFYSPTSGEDVSCYTCGGTAEAHADGTHKRARTHCPEHGCKWHRCGCEPVNSRGGVS